MYIELQKNNLENNQKATGEKGEIHWNLVDTESANITILYIDYLQGKYLVNQAIYERKFFLKSLR